MNSSDKSTVCKAQSELNNPTTKLCGILKRLTATLKLLSDTKKLMMLPTHFTTLKLLNQMTKVPSLVLSWANLRLKDTLMILKLFLIISSLKEQLNTATSSMLFKINSTLLLMPLMEFIPSSMNYLLQLNPPLLSNSETTLTSPSSTWSRLKRELNSLLFLPKFFLDNPMSVSLRMFLIDSHNFSTIWLMTSQIAKTKSPRPKLTLLKSTTLLLLTTIPFLPHWTQLLTDWSYIFQILTQLSQLKTQFKLLHLPN